MKNLFLIKTLSFCLIFFLLHPSSAFGGAGAIDASFTADKSTFASISLVRR